MYQNIKDHGVMYFGLLLLVALHLFGDYARAAKYNYMVSDEWKSRAAAQSDCEAQGGDLASITDSTIQNTVYHLIKRGYYYIGAKRSNSKWAWNDGTLVTYDKWYWQPTSDRGGCATISGKKLYQRSCSSTYQYICQIAVEYKYTVSTVKKKWEAARSDCKTGGGDLASITNETIQNTVYDLIKRQRGFVSYNYYIGAKRREDGDEWFWSDGTPVTYDEWNAPPISMYGGCSMIQGSDGKWVQRKPSYEHRYICQTAIRTTTTTTTTTTATTPPDPCAGRSCSSRGTCENGRCNCNDGYSGDNCEQVLVQVTTPKVIPSVIYVPVSTSVPREITCTADGNPSPTVRWFKPRDSKVAHYYSTTSKVYQTNSRLKIQYAEKADAGVYTCKAWNDINGETFEEYANATLKVLGRPKILRANQSYCQTNISVKVEWEPDPDSLSIAHRINVYKEGVGWIGRIDVVPTKLQEVTTIGDLQRETTYYILIEVCPESCINKLAVVSENFKTAGGLPRSVSNAQTQLPDSVGKKQCVVTWIYDISSEEYPSYEINATSSLIYKSPLATTTEFIETRNTTETYFNFQTEPNRKYQFSIRARTCAGLGPPTMVSGQCITDAEAPKFVPKPTTTCATSNCIGTTLSMKIEFPDETNGLISCVFVIMYLDNGGNLSALTRSELTAIANETQYQESNRYISLAIPRKNITGNNLDVILGDERATSCDITDGMQANTRKKRAVLDKVYEGRNWPMTRGNNYGIIVVTSTPSKGGKVFFRSSEPDMFIAISEPQGTSSTWIVGVIIGLLVLFILIAVLIFFLKRRDDAKNENKPQERNNNHPLEVRQRPQESHSIDATMEESPYETAMSDQSETKILLRDLLETYKSMKENDSLTFFEQFGEIGSIADGNKPAVVVVTAGVKKKNRYTNILPYERTAVRLTGERAEDKYINASYVDGYQQPRKFIATQGPLPQTVKDFWRMVVEQKCKVIVMLAKCMEVGKKKCEKYWPDRGESMEVQQIKVTNIEVANCGGFTKTRIMIHVNASQEDWEVHHYQFLKWPDHGVPLSTSSFFRMHKEVIKSQNIGHARTPMIVHCSAGCGRTGTFIAYDILLNGCRILNYIDVFSCVVNMRKQRIQMVQNGDQYILIHKLLLEAFLFEDSDAEVIEFPYNMEVWNRADSVRIQEEFKNVAISDSIHRSKGNASRYADMNRDQNIVPYDDTRIVITSLQEDMGAVYINASNIETYDASYRMIAAQGPMDNTVEYFWRGILDNNVNTIVMLTTLREDDQEQCVRYWPGSVGAKDKIGNKKITLVSEETSGQIVTRKLTVERGKCTKNITQLQYIDWISTACPQNATDLMDVVQKMQTSIRQESSSTVLIHCSDGAGRTGAFCAIVNLIERVKAENRVDVFRAVKDLRDYRPGMVQTVDQYLFCYQSVLSYLLSFSDYANFNQNEDPVYQNM